MNITKSQYEFALAKIEELLPVVSEEAPVDDKDAVELSILSDVVIEYEKEHFPIEKPTVAELVELSLEEKNMTQKQLAEEIGVTVFGREEHDPEAVGGRNRSQPFPDQRLCERTGRADSQDSQFPL